MTSQSPRHALVGWALTILAVVATAWFAGVAGAGSTAAEHAPAALLVFAAASLSEALDEVDRAFTARTGVRVNASYAASSVLAKQIEAGAPADAFFSADLAWVDYLDERGLLKRGSRCDVLGNSLVLIAPADSPLRLSITPGFDITARAGRGTTRDRGPGLSAGGEVCARCAEEARCVAARVGSPGTGRERARGARVRGARGGAAGHRVSDRRAGREARARGRCVSRGQSPTHHLSGGADAQGSPRGGAVRGLSDERHRAADFHALRVYSAALGSPRFALT
jgi:hypothetical protein